MATLVFVEGVPGSGKSTTAQFIARQLTAHGQPARWLYEDERPNPLVPDAPAAGYRSWDQFVELRVERWRTHARELSGASGTVVADSALLQRPVFTMLRRDVETPLIERLLNRLADAVAALHPRLVYLGHRDPEHAWRAVAARRGPGFTVSAVRRSEEWPFTQSRGLAGLNGLLTYWRLHGALCDHVVSWLPMSTLRLDVTDGAWPAYRQRIGEFLALPSGPAPLDDHAAPARLAGRYRLGERLLSVVSEEGRLVLRGQLWESNALLPVSEHVFDVEGWPFQLRFEEGPDGNVRALHWHGPSLVSGSLGGVYERVPA